MRYIFSIVSSLHTDIVRASYKYNAQIIIISRNRMVMVWFTLYRRRVVHTYNNMYDDDEV